MDGVIPSNNDYLARKISSLASNGKDVSSLISILVSLQNPDSGWGISSSYIVSNPVDTTLTLQALKSLNYPDQNIISSALGYLLSTQNPDGGWGFYSGDSSNVYMTALVSSTLQRFPQTTSIATAINKATSYLISKQQADGSWGTVYETALAYIALVGVTTDNTVLGNAINYLISTQLPNGSWNDDPYSTALALRALAMVKPNLTISASDITLSNTAPTVGETITITATIRNTGPAHAENVLVGFYEGDPNSGGTLIGETAVPSIPSFGSSQTSIAWVIPSASSKRIFVVIDALNTVEELDEADNIASLPLTIATLPDLSISASDMSFTPSAPLANQPVTVAAIVRNKGQSGASNTAVDIFDGDPASGGRLIGSSTVPAIDAGGSTAIFLETNLPAGSHDIYVVVDAVGAIAEGSETNNIAAKTLIVGGGYIDLAVTGADITHTPSGPAEGDIVTVNVTIKNEGEAEARNVLVRFYLGDPAMGGTPIGSDLTIPVLPGRGMVPGTLQWNSSGHAGSNDICIVLDPENALSESSELNNKACHSIRVAARTGPDLTVSSTDITISPLSPVTGDTLSIAAKVRNTGTEDAYNVPVEFSLGDPDVGGTLIIGSVTVAQIPKGGFGVAQISWNTTGFPGTYELYMNADPFNLLAELDEGNNLSHTALLIGAFQGPDLSIDSLDETAVLTDTQALTVSGALRVAFKNKGNMPAEPPFEITAFEDRNGNQLPDPEDILLGRVTYTATLAPGGSALVDIPLLGSVPFRGSLIHVALDSSKVVSELDETNNTRNTGQSCAYQPPTGSFNPVEKFAWTGSTVLSAYNQVMSAPMVVNLTDDNGDGRIDDNDMPDILFVTAQPGDIYGTAPGVLRAISGDDGHEVFTVTDLNQRLTWTATLAVGDIDGDGRPEIIGTRYGGGTIAFEHDGTVKWTSSYGNAAWGGISIADIDHDGHPEIIIGATVLNNDGTLKWQGTAGQGSNYGRISLVADVDMDGLPEIVAGNTVYRNDGGILWHNTALGDGFNAVADFDDDPYPEIVLVSNGKVYLLEHNGQVRWGPVSIPSGGRGGAPTVADFDGDGRPEIAIAGAARYIVLKADGSILWQSVIQDLSSNLTGSSVFDFDGDGRAEVVYNDEKYLRIYRGSSGQVLFSTPNSSATAVEYPIVADIDRDNHAELVIAANDYYPPTLINGKGYHGIRVFEDANNTWVNTRKIWNQHSYHITNINGDGTVPRFEQNNWETYNNYRCNSLLPETALGVADVAASYITADQANYPQYVSLSARIGNGGAASLTSGVEVAFYDGDPASGGVLIGTVSTSRQLDPGQYEDVSTTWNTPSFGSHSIFVVGDIYNKLNECREDNNTASGTFNITGTQPPGPPDLPDLDISPLDVTLILPVIEGQTAVLSAIIHNKGTLWASNAAVAFYDGDPANGGTLIGTAVQSYIEAGATALAQITWNTMGQTGRNYIHVIIDPQDLIAETNEANNETLIPVDVTPPTLPDLAVTSSDIAFSSLNPGEGETLTITATIHNLGLDTSGMEVTLYDGDPSAGGVSLATQGIARIVPLGGSISVTFSIDTLGLSGNRRFYITVDPGNAISETNETNNTAWGSVVIGPTGLNLTSLTDKAVYQANEDVRINVSITEHQGTDRTGTLDVKITDLGNNVVTLIASSQPLTLLANGTNSLSYAWNTGRTMTGDYKVFAAFTEAGIVKARAEAPFSISPDQSVSAKITTDKTSYSPNQSVTLTSLITSQSANYIFENLTARVNVTDSLGTVLLTGTQAIPVLTPGQGLELKTYWNTSVNPPGSYPVTLSVTDSSGSILSTDTATLTIGSDIKPSALLKGSISVDKQHILQGEPVNITYSVTNVGNMDLSAIELSVLTVHVSNLTVYDTLTDHTALAMGRTYTSTGELSTLGYSAKDYLVVLRARVGTAEDTLAGTYFRVEGAPSEPTLSAPSKGSDVETLTPLLTVNNASDPNDDRLTYEFELYEDSGLKSLISSSGSIPEGTNTTSWQAPLSLTENMTYFWRARAYDGLLYGQWMYPASFRVNTVNEPPAAPSLSGPEEGASVSTLTPLLSVRNATDPDSVNLTYNFELSSDPSFTEKVASQTGVFEEEGITSWQVPVTLTENTTYFWRAQADDWFMTGPWMGTASFFVNTANDAPTSPVIISPSDQAEITSLALDITVSNSQDPDSPSLSYLFELDTALAFDSPDLIRSGIIPEGQGTTLWQTGALRDNTWYFARAKAADGETESPWSNPVGFFVNTQNDAPSAPVPANPSDGAGVNTFTPTLSVHNADDIDGDTLTYEFELYEDSAMINLLTSTADIQETPQITSWTAPLVLTENSTYHWRARAYDGGLYSPWTSLSSFMVNTANDAPGAPTLNAPADGASLYTLTPVLSVHNAPDPDSDTLTYDLEIYTGGQLIRSMTGIPQGLSGTTSVTLDIPLSDNTAYTWRARAYDGDRYGAWMDMAAFTIHIPSNSITVTIDFDPDTLNKKSKGNWVVVYIELPGGYNAADIDINSIRLNGTVPAEPWPYALGDHDKDGIADLMVKFDRNAVINLLPNGENVTVHVTGTAGTKTFEGVDVIRVMP